MLDHCFDEKTTVDRHFDGGMFGGLPGGPERPSSKLEQHILLCIITTDIKR